MFKSKFAQILSVSVCSVFAVGMLSQVSLAASVPSSSPVRSSLSLAGMATSDSTGSGCTDMFFGLYAYQESLPNGNIYFFESNPSVVGYYNDDVFVSSSLFCLCNTYYNDIRQMTAVEFAAQDISSAQACQDVASLLNQYNGQLDLVKAFATEEGISSSVVDYMYEAWNIKNSAYNTFESILETDPSGWVSMV